MLERRLNNDDLLFFLHIPKTAGSSLNYIVENNFGLHQVCQSRIFESLADLEAAMSEDIRYISGHFFYDIVKGISQRPIQAITMLRNPIERTLSALGHVERWSDLFADQSEREQFREARLESFVHNHAMMDQLSIHNTQSDMLSIRFDLDHLARISDFHQIALAGIAPLSAAEAQAELERFAFVGLAERFRDSVDLLSYTFGWPHWRDLPFINVSPKRPSLDQLPRGAIEALWELNGEDVALYEHAERSFASRHAWMTEDLVERYGNRLDRPVTGPVTRETLSRLLDEHYDQRFDEVHTPADRLRVELGGAISGIGWYGAEPHPDYGAVRWIGPAPAASLNLALTSDRDLHIRTLVVNTMDHEVLTSLTMRVNSVPIALDLSFPEAGGAVLDGVVPRAALATGRSYARITFRAERAIRVQDLDPASADERQLAVAIHSVEIEPA